MRMFWGLEIIQSLPGPHHIISNGSGTLQTYCFSWPGPVLSGPRHQLRQWRLPAGLEPRHMGLMLIIITFVFSKL